MNNQPLTEKKKDFSGTPLGTEKLGLLPGSSSYSNPIFRDTDFISRSPYWDDFISTLGCVILIKDIRSQQIDYISSNLKELWGYEVDLFYDSEISSLTDIIHPNDILAIGKIEKVVIEQINNTPSEDRKAFKFNFNYRLRKADGTYIQILEQNSVFQLDDLDNVTHLQIVCSNISNLMGSEKAPLSFSPYQNDRIPLEKQKGKLSSREIEVIRLIANGDNSKSIASKLSISFNTVNTHRQHIFAKTKTRNASELVQYANNHRLV